MRKSRLTALALLAAAFAVPATAQAATSTDTTSVTLTAGALSFTANPLASDFPSTALTGATQTVRTPFSDWSVKDATGSGAGWNVTLAASRFSNAGATNTLPLGSLNYTPAAATPTKVDPLNLSLPPIVQLPTPPATAYTLDSGSGVKVVSALAGTGAGEWSFDQQNLAGGDLALTIPANAIADTYTSTITETLSTGP
jgi:hypothetical protein